MVAPLAAKHLGKLAFEQMVHLRKLSEQMQQELVRVVLFFLPELLLEGLVHERRLQEVVVRLKTPDLTHKPSQHLPRLARLSLLLQQRRQLLHLQQHLEHCVHVTVVQAVVQAYHPLYLERLLFLVLLH